MRSSVARVRCFEISGFAHTLALWLRTSFCPPILPLNARCLHWQTWAACFVCDKLLAFGLGQLMPSPFHRASVCAPCRRATCTHWGCCFESRFSSACLVCASETPPTSKQTLAYRHIFHGTFCFQPSTHQGASEGNWNRQTHFQGLLQIHLKEFFEHLNLTAVFLANFGFRHLCDWSHPPIWLLWHENL